MWYLFSCDYGNLRLLSDSIVSNGFSDHCKIWVPFCCGKPVFDNLVFVNTSPDFFRDLTSSEISSFHPVDDQETGAAKTFSDSEVSNLQVLLGSNDPNILTDQNDVPKYLSGGDVEIVSGPFAGITGKELRFHSQRRVFFQLKGLGTFATTYVAKEYVRRVVVTKDESLMIKA